MKWNDAFRQVLAEIESRVDALVAPMREITRPVIATDDRLRK